MKRRKKNLISQAALTLLALFLLGGALSVSAFFYYAKDLPDPASIVARRVSESTKIFDRTGNTVLYDIHGEEKRTVIPWEEIPETIKSATLVSEDNAFYSHQGLDWRGIARALIKNLLNLGVSQGGSTISQQLVKNALLEQDRTIPRKIKEAVLTIEIERRFSKDQIFWMYLNQIPYGSNSYGIEAASQNFFGKPAKELSYAQAALLATLTKATSYYSPYGNHLEETLARKDSLLKRMLDLGRITQTQYDSAKKEQLEFKPPRDNILAPHFVIMVRDYLIKKYGEETVTNGGLRVFTTLDYKTQTIAQETVTKYGDINAKKYKANNAALVAIDPRTGQILAMVGARDYFDIKNQGNFNVATAQRQPGSAFKPFAYATAIGLGYPDTTIFFDYKTEFNANCSPDGNGIKDRFGVNCYNPQNYDGRYRGPVTMREALAQSLNLPSVKLLYLAGVDRVIDLATSMGITTLQANRKNFGLSLVLGGAEVKLVDLVSAYGVFANDGMREETSFLLRVEDANGNILEEYKPKEEQVLDPQVARMVSSILSDNQARTPIFGPNSSLYFPGRPVAAKTGTTQENRDGWALGYTPSLAIGVWTGNNDNTPMTREGAGVSAAGPMFHEFITRTLSNTPVENFIEPVPMTTDKIMLSGSYINATSNPDGSTGQAIHSILYYVDRNNPLGDSPTNPSNDPQFNNWETAVVNNSSGLLNQTPINQFPNWLP